MPHEPDHDMEQRINAALERANGDRGYAAVVLGMSVREVVLAIKASAKLRSRWDDQRLREEEAKACETPEAPTPEAALDRTNPFAPVDVRATEPTRAEIEAMEAYAKQDSLLRRGLGLLQLSNREVLIADGLAQFNREYFATMLHMTTGGAARISIILQAEVDNVRQQMDDCSRRLADDQLYPIGSEKREAVLAEQRDLREALDRFTTNIRLLANQAMTAAFTQAAIHAKNKEGPKRGKPGFSANPTTTT